MKQRSEVAVGVAAALFAGCDGSDASDTHVAEQAIAVLSSLRTGFGRWIGPAGYDILIERARGVMRGECAWIGNLSRPEPTHAELIALMSTVGRHAVLSGLGLLVATIIELLGRMIGQEMAVQLVQNLAAAKPDSVVRTTLEATQDE